MSKLPPRPHDRSQVLGDLLRRITDVERVLQQVEGSVSPFDGSAQGGMMASASIGGADVGAGQLDGSHVSSLALASLVASSGTQFQGNTYFGSGAQVVLASGVSQPITSPGLVLETWDKGLLAPLSTYYVAFSWYDGVHETTVSVPVASIKTTAAANAIKVVLPIAPTGATEARIYMDTASFGVGGGKKQVDVAVSTTAATEHNFFDFDSGGHASVAATTFPASNTAKIEPASAVDSAGNAYGWSFEGSGRARFLAGPTINAQFWLYDDFYYPSGVYPGTGAATTFGELQSIVSGTGASVNAGTSLNTDPGVVQVQTGTTTTGKATVRCGSSFGFGDGRIRYTAMLMFDTAPGASNTFQITLGITTSVASGTGMVHMAAGDEGVSLQFASDSSASPQLVLVTGDGTSITTSAGVAVTAGNGYFVEWEIDAGLTGVDWWVNGVKQARQTTHLPRSIAPVRGCGFGIEKTNTGAGTTNRTLNVDTLAVFGDYVSG